MMEIIAKAINPLIIIFLTSTMLACGLGLTVKEIIAPFRNVRLTISAALMNFLVVPFIAIAAARLVGLEESLRYGLVLICHGRAGRGEPEVHHQRKGERGSFRGAPDPVPGCCSSLLPSDAFRAFARRSI